MTNSASNIKLIEHLGDLVTITSRVANRENVHPGTDLRLLWAPAATLERSPISNEEGGGKRIYFGIGAPTWWWPQALAFIRYCTVHLFHEHIVDKITIFSILFFKWIIKGFNTSTHTLNLVLIDAVFSMIQTKFFKSTFSLSL